MKFLSVAATGTISTLILGGTALPLIDQHLTNSPGSRLPLYHIGVPDPIPENCGLHCPMIARSPTPKPVILPELKPDQLSGPGILRGPPLPYSWVLAGKPQGAVGGSGDHNAASH